MLVWYKKTDNPVDTKVAKSKTILKTEVDLAI